MDNWILLIIGLLILSTLLRVFSPNFKGWVGETTVSTILSTLPQEEYRIINYIMLHTKKGTTQIDHVVVSAYGIFVIETKNYTGWITGTENSEQWIKNMYGKKYPFRNPIKQNYGHVKALESRLELPSNVFIPIVVFSGSAELKVKTYHHVIYAAKLKEVIFSYTEKMIDSVQLEQIVPSISEANVDSRENRKEHVKNIRCKVTAERQNVRAGKCPRCGGLLVNRSGKYGTFVGCSNYPKCSYTVKT